MAFTSFKSLDEVLRRYSIRLERREFVDPGPYPRPPDHVLADLRYTMTRVPFYRAEGFAREALIYPILREVARHYDEHLSLFSHEPVEADEMLRGELDYLVCRLSPHGPFTPDQPILLVGEAKRDDYLAGWAQALAGMMAARRLAPQPAPVLYGLTTSGQVWSFGRLEGDTFTEDPRTRSATDPDGLFAALHFVFAACRDQLLSAPVPAA